MFTGLDTVLSNPVHKMHQKIKSEMQLSYH